MSDRDPITEQAINEVAEILAKGYLRLLMNPSAETTGSAAPPAAAAVEKKPASSAKRKGDDTSKPERSQPPEPLPVPPKVSAATRPPIPESLRAEIAEKLQKLTTMNSSELRAEYQRVFNKATTSTNRQHLLRRIAWEIQAQAEGRLSEEVREYACRVAEQTDMFRRLDEALEKRRASPATPKLRHRAKRPPAKKRDPRIPAPGSLLIVKQGRQTVRVTVLQAGFEYAGKPYRSLTAVARQVAGRNVNAYEFFGLGTPPETACDS